MKASELAALSLKDLRTLRERVDTAIAEREVQDRADVKAKLADIAAKAGFSVGELFGPGRSGKRVAAAIKYRNPKDPSQTWTGRGRKPTWIVAAGGDVQRFRV
jgi:DNA-binding protein H-NS